MHTCKILGFYSEYWMRYVHLNLPKGVDYIRNISKLIYHQWIRCGRNRSVLTSDVTTEKSDISHFLFHKSTFF